MSNYLAIATVTATLRYLLLKHLPPDLSGAQVTTLRPDAQLSAADVAGINVFLYEAVPNVAYRNTDLPSRRTDGSVAQTPQLALDLRYLLTFYGSDAELEPQRLMGAAATTLHTYPLLSSQEIQQALANSPPFNAGLFTGAPFTSPPYQPDLAYQAERIKLMPMTLSLEELSKLWSVFYQIPFALTMAYQASVVLLQSVDVTPQSGLAVQRRSVVTVPANTPQITEIVLASDRNAPITPGSAVLLHGAGLRATGLVVQFANNDALVVPTAQSDTELAVTLPPTLPAGPQGVQAVLTVPMGMPAVPHIAMRSSTAAFVLHPVVAAAVDGTGGNVTVKLTPSARAGQRLTLLLNQSSTPAVGQQPRAHLLALAPLAADAATVAFPALAVEMNIPYFVRVQVDGAESPLDLDPASATFGPTVTLT